jgi:TPR repeat protein
MWLRKAAEHGKKIAQFDLGVCYAERDGVTKDLEQARI